MSDRGIGENPYVGLRPFFQEDSYFFFGREQQTSDLLEILQSHRFLGIVGSSGSGKSSLVRAGLLPALLGGFLVRDRDAWHAVQIKPGDAPLSNLADGLLKAVGEERTPATIEAFAEEIRESHTAAVVEFLQEHLQDNFNLFLLVDQFEEVFAFRGDDTEEAMSVLSVEQRQERARRVSEAAAFVDLILKLAEQRDIPIYVAITMRSDFLGDCDVFYSLPEALNQGRYLVPRMDREQLRDAIECPALLRDVQVSPRLLDHILNEMGDRADWLPVMQHALLRTWDQWQRNGAVGQLDLQHMQAAGGLDGALEQDAETALRGLDYKTSKAVFQRLTDTDLSSRRIRSPARISELVASANTDIDTVKNIVHCFQSEDRSFVHRSNDGNPKDQRVDISHESLIRQWRKLRKWVDEERDSRDIYKELVKRAKDYSNGKAGLLANPELQKYVDWKLRALPTVGWADRYSSIEEEFREAMAYLDLSLRTHVTEVSENELRRRWVTIKLPLIAVLALLVLLIERQEVEGFLELVSNSNVDSLAALVDIVFNFENFRNVFFLAIAVGVTIVVYEGLKQFHRRRLLPKIYGIVEKTNGKNPYEAKERLRKERKSIDPLQVHQTCYANVFRRVLAYMIDIPVYFFLLALAMALPGIYFEINVLSFDDVFEEILFGADSFYPILFGAMFVVGWLYFTLSIKSKHQATIGMRIMKIFRTDVYGERLSFGHASVCYLFRFLSYLFWGIPFLILFITKRKQTGYDKLALSIVLKRVGPFFSIPGKPDTNNPKNQEAPKLNS